MTEFTFPFAIIECVNQIPQPIFAAAFSRSDVKRVIQLTTDLKEDEIRTTAQQRITELLNENGGGFAGFGRALGYVVNFSEGHAERFDLEGKFLEKLNENIWPGFASVSLR